MIVGNGELVDLMSTMALMRFDHGIQFSEVDAMVPFEMQMFILMLVNHMKEEAQRRQR